MPLVFCVHIERRMVMIITLARQCGSNGTLIGRNLSKKYGLPLFDLRSLAKAAKAEALVERFPEFFAERPMNILISAITLSAVPESVKDLAENILTELLPEDNFILIGRCGNFVYGDRPECVRIFLCGAFETRVKELMGRYNISESVAENKVREADENRLAYHRYFTGTTWGQADQYDLTLNSCRLGVEGTEKIIEQYINTVFAGKETGK